MGDQPVLMARMELRRIPMFGGVVGWVPRGPAGAAFDKDALALLTDAARCRLSLSSLTAGANCRRTNAACEGISRPETIWIDLSAGKDCYLAETRQTVAIRCRQGAARGVRVEQSESDEDKIAFLELNRSSVIGKILTLPFAAALSRYLLRARGPVSAHLFVRAQAMEIGGKRPLFSNAAVPHITFQGAPTDIIQSYGVGEVLHWSIIEWASNRVRSCMILKGSTAKKSRNICLQEEDGGPRSRVAGKEYFAPFARRQSHHGFGSFSRESVFPTFYVVEATSGLQLLRSALGPVRDHNAARTLSLSF